MTRRSNDSRDPTTQVHSAACRKRIREVLADDEECKGRKKRAEDRANTYCEDVNRDAEEEESDTVQSTTMPTVKVAAVRNVLSVDTVIEVLWAIGVDGAAQIYPALIVKVALASTLTRTP